MAIMLTLSNGISFGEIKMRFALICLVLLFSSNFAAQAQTINSSNSNLEIHSRQSIPVGSTYYLHLGADLKGQDPHALNEELQLRFTNVLDALKKKIIFSWTMQAEGEGKFFFNLILEPVTQNDLEDLNTYIAKAESIDFHGISVRFDRVESISEIAILEAGNYDERFEDPFSQNFSLPKKFEFNNLAGWVNFSNQYGFALLNRDSAAFLKYLAGFVADDSAYQNLLGVLSENNMVAIEPEASLHLEGGSLVGHEMVTSPFLPFKFFRNCYEQRFENGACYRPTATPEL